MTFAEEDTDSRKERAAFVMRNIWKGIQMRKNYLPIELGVALKEQFNIKEDLLFEQPHEHEVYTAGSGYGTEYYTWGQRAVDDPVPMRVVAFMERPMEWRTESRSYQHPQGHGLLITERNYDSTYHLSPGAVTGRCRDEEIWYMYLGGYIYKDGQLAYKLYNDNLINGDRHNGCKIKLAKYFQQESWTEFKRSKEFQEYLPIQFMDATA